MSAFTLVLVLVAFAMAAESFCSSPVLRSSRASSLAPLKSWDSLLTAVTEMDKPDDYVYGAVAAPAWVAPVAALLVVLTAGIPILLSPGEKALEQQRKNEEITGSEFGKNRKKDL